jgi:hypothetical protein
LLLVFAVVLAIVIAAGCGGGSQPKTPVLSGNTEVTVLLSSAANDQLQLFQIGFSNLTLTNQSGQTVTLLSTQAAQSAEFININGGASPLLTVSVPQGIYTAASSTNLSFQFVCATFVPPNILDTSTFADPFGGPDATINFPTPITITGTSMALSLDLLVSQSETFSACYNSGSLYTYTFTPTFNLSPLTLSPQPTNPGNGKLSGVHGEVSSIDAASNSFSVSLPVENGLQTVAITANSGTVYQGINDFSALAVGTFVDMDGAIQPSGSLVATRIAVEDSSAVNILTGRVIYVVPSVTDINIVSRQEQGADFMNQEVFGGWAFNYGSAVFQISGQLSNLQSLPFTPSFTASNMVAGQNIYLSAPAIPEEGPFVEARTITLIPQTIDGTVAATSNSGNFTVYTVTLAPYDIFPAMAVQPQQITLLTDPSQVEVYIDSNTQMLNSEALAVGSTLLFNGLIFNDNGTLRMDCGQVNDGVAVQSGTQAAVAGHSTQGGVVVHQYPEHLGASK